MQTEVWLWLILGIILVLIEVSTVNFLTIWFAAGAFVTIIPASLGAPLWVQVLVFSVTSFIALILTKPFVRKLRKAPVATNADMVIGQTGVVLEQIDNIKMTGRVSAGGLEWTARSEENSPIEADSKVRVLRIEGVKLIVKPLE